MTTVEHQSHTEHVRGPASEPPRGLWRLSGVLGIAFVVITVGSLAARHDTPVWTDPVETIRSYWIDNGDRYLVAQYLFGLAAVIMFLGFLVGLSAMMDRGDAESRAISRLILVAGGVQVAFLLAADAAWATLATSAPALDDQSVMLLTFLDRGAYETAGFASAVFVVATSFAILRRTEHPRWLGVVGLVSAVGLLVSPLSILDDGPEGTLENIGFLALVVMMVFIIALSVSMLRRSRPARGTSE
jgi:hypothetical protein